VALPETFSSFDATRDTGPVLPIPHLSDSPNELLSKLAAIADVLRAGKSIAEATAYSVAPTQDRNAEKRAVSQMRLKEQELWTTFRDGLWHLLVGSGSAQACSPSAQVKAAAAHVRRLKQNRRG
jgi:hypothetical protein